MWRQKEGNFVPIDLYPLPKAASKTLVIIGCPWIVKVPTKIRDTALYVENLPNNKIL